MNRKQITCNCQVARRRENESRDRSGRKREETTFSESPSYHGLHRWTYERIDGQTLLASRDQARVTTESGGRTTYVFTTQGRSKGRCPLTTGADLRRRRPTARPNPDRAKPPIERGADPRPATGGTTPVPSIPGHRLRDTWSNNRKEKK